MNKTYLPLVVALSVGTSGCFLGKQTKVKVPSAPPSTTPATTQPPAAEPAAASSEGAETAPVNPPAPSALPTIPPPAQSSAPPVPIPTPAPAPVPKRRVIKTNPAPPALPAPPAVSPLPEPAAGPLPQLAEILTADQRRQYQAEYAQDLARSNAALKQAGGRSLSAAQRETVTRIRTFLTQAAAARYNDIATAVELSRRADLLGQELLKDLR